MVNKSKKREANKYKKLAEYSRKLASEKNHQKLLELILRAMKDITNSDGGTLYFKNTSDKLEFAVVTNTSLDLQMGGTYKTPVYFKPLPLFEGEGIPNHKNIACHCALSKKTIVLEDAYTTTEYNFSGTKAFDLQTGYRTKSVLTLPLINLENKVLGVTQLINAQDNRLRTISYTHQDIQLAEILASLAAIALSNQNLHQKLENMFSQFAEVLATAIDNKSAYTGKHCDMVYRLAMMITNEIHKSNEPPFKHFKLDANGYNEMRLATLLHDCGKICTPPHIMDKATKLETIFDRIELIRTKFEVLKRDTEISFLKNNITKEVYEENLRNIQKDILFLQKMNIGQECMSDLEAQRIKKIAQKTWMSPDGLVENILTLDEIENLSIRKGTLTNSERDMINQHSEITLKMLSQLEFPEHLKNIPDIAASHHEKLNGKGHPRGLHSEQISLQARILGIADIFEALTSKDRPYKKGKTLSESLFIMGRMVETGELDQDIFQLFIERKLYLQYAQEHLEKYQITDLDLDNLPGYHSKDRSLTIKKAA